MSAPTFIFGADGLPKTPQEAARLRAIAQAMAPQGAPKNVGEGLTSLGNAIAYRMMMNKAAKGEAQGKNAANNAFSALMGSFGGGSDPAPSATSPAPAMSSEASAAPAPVPTNQPPIPGIQPVGNDLAGGIKATAQGLGIDPVDLATAISYETAGTFDPTKSGPTTQWGKHRGLIQFGEPQAEKYGVNWEDPVNSQLGPRGAIAKYLIDAGVKPGMGMMEIYSAINAGRVGRYGASDANNGGAPGTVADKVNNQMSGHRQKALALLGGSPDGGAVSAVNAMAEAPPQPMQPVEVAQAGNGRRGIMDALMGGQPRSQDMPTDYFPAAPNPAGVAGPSRQQIMRVLTDQYATPEQRAIAQDAYQQMQQANDPAYQMQLEKSRLELDAMRNPKVDPLKVGQGEKFIDPRTGQVLFEGDPKPEEKPTDVKEYEYAKQHGYEGTFPQFQMDMKKAGASQVNIDQKAEGAFDKKLAEKQAESFDVMATEGMNARSDLAVIGELGTLMQGRGGTLDGLSGALAKYGIGGEGVGDIQAAQALINRLVPTQRQPGSGSMSDRDVELFTRSLPSLWNQPGGNERILSTMQGLAQYKQAQGDIAQRVMMGEIDRQTATKMLRELPNPLAVFKLNPNEIPEPEGVEPEVWDAMTPEEKALWK